MCVILHNLPLCGQGMEIKILRDTVLKQHASTSCYQESRLERFSEEKCIHCRQDAEDKAESWPDIFACSKISEKLAAVELGEESPALTYEESIVHKEYRRKKNTWKMRAKKKRKVRWIIQESEEKRTEKNAWKWERRGNLKFLAKDDNSD